MRVIVITRLIFDRGHLTCDNVDMTKVIQKRTLETRARLIAAAENIIAEAGFEALRVEEVVSRAGTAKGTFFAHFRDKDSMMVRVVGARIDAFLDDMKKGPAPRTVEEIVTALMPLCTFMASERYVFDLILRHSGAAAIEEIGEIATTFGRQQEIFERWLTAGAFRKDVPVSILAEGMQAFCIQTIALRFCALHAELATDDQLRKYFAAWLAAPGDGL